MKFKSFALAAFAVALSCVQAFGQATLLPPGEQCFQATAGLNGMVGLLGTITGGSLYTNGTYGGVALTGGSGTNATANITVSGGIVTSVAVLNPGVNYVIADVLSASAASIGGTGAGFSVPVSSISINSSLAGGTVAYYIPNTLTFKQTWQDSGEITLNTNPVGLDANGCAIVYGAGVYRQILKDSLGNTVWDKLTASTGPSGIFWAGLAGGTGNAITVVDTAFANQDGATIQFLAAGNNSGPTTVSVSGGTPIAIVRDTTTGPAALSGQEIAVGNTPMITYDATNVEFHIINPANTAASGGGTSSLTPPQGYLNLVGQATGDVLQPSTDVTGVSTVFYSPFVGNTLPIWNGSVFKSLIFSELTATLTAAGSPSNTIQDSCVFSNNGVPTLVTSPSWTTVTAGSGNRGTGAGTPQLTRLQGIWVNAVTMIGYNGLSSFSIPANQCTYVGSLSIDATAGQVSAYRTWGQSRKFGVWNAYNRQQIYLLAGDSTGTITPSGGSFAALNGNSANVAFGFTGLPEEAISANYLNIANATYSSNTSSASIAIGINSTSSTSGLTGTFAAGNTTTTGNGSGSAAANYTLPPTIGINAFQMLNARTNTGTLSGGQSNCQMTLSWRG
jgi:hypothetical protein